MKKVIIVNFVAKHSYLFIRKMIEGFVNNDCEVIAIVSKNMPELEEWRAIENMRLFEVDGYTSFRDFPIKLLKLLFVQGPKIKELVSNEDISFVYLPIFTYWSVFINLLLRKIPFVYAMHDPEVHNKRRLVSRAMNYLLGVRAMKIVILSETFRPLVIKKYNKSNSDIVTIPSGVECEVSSTNVNLIEYPEDKVNFLFHGRIDKYKGLDVLAEAYSKLKSENHDITLTIAGSGDFSLYQEMYSDLVDCRIINKWLTNDEVAGLFNGENVITILPYKTATQSGVINVAMPCGSPIIATKTGGIVEQIKDGETGYLIEPNDVNALYEKMKYVTLHLDELDTIRENALKRVKSLSWDDLAGRLLNSIK